MIEAEPSTNDRPAPKRRSRRRVIASAAGAVILSAAGSGLLIADASAGTVHLTAHTAGAVGATGSGPYGGPFGFGPGGTPPAAAGTVESVNASGDSFTVKNHAGTTVTVDVSSSTTYSDPTVSSASLSNVTAGEQVAVIGSVSSDVVTATKVLIGVPTAGPGGRGFGPGGWSQGANTAPSPHE